MTNRIVCLNSILSLGLVALFSCGAKEKKEEKLIQKQQSNARAPIRVDGFIATQKTLLDRLETPGTLVANQAADIHPEVAGRITGIYFKEGAVVNQGALLVKLYDADLQAQRQKLLVQIRVAESNQNRSEQLLKIGGISREDYENTLLTASSARADLAVLMTSIRKTEIRAPFTGKLGLRMVSVGAYVSPSSVVTNISALNQMRIDFTVPEKYTSQISLGQYVNFTVEGSTNKYSARVIATESNISQNTRTLQVRAMVQGNQAGLVPGGFAKVTLDFQPDANSIVVPTQAIIPEARGKKIYVYKDSVAKYVDVTTGLRDTANIQITSGINAGDTVLISGLLSLKPNAKVMLRRVVNGTKQPARRGDSTNTNAGKRK